MSYCKTFRIFWTWRVLVVITPLEVEFLSVRFPLRRKQDSQVSRTDHQTPHSDAISEKNLLHYWLQWKPVLRPTPLMRSPRYYGHFLLAWQNGNTLSYIKKMLMRSLVNTTNGHCFKFQTPIVLYNITPLIQPLEKTKTRVTCQFHWWSLSFINQIAAGFLSLHYCATSSNIRLHKLRLTHWIIVVYNKEVEYEVFRTTPWRSVFIIKMACFFFSRNLLFVCGSL